MGANVSCYFKILAFAETQFERECPRGEQTISAETLSKSPNLKSGLKFRKLHFHSHSEISFRIDCKGLFLTH